ncbi:class I SAM-dependent methyltransferase [Embleya hyalina]|uniref:Putative methyltransferase n=1 Tax=Embleya hyalina TaxID=516124 RepID=A0A401YQY1_9ACTN|nr:class I SAM-dependent methyltransferase [Embleya hyalina]GCD97001.1 putative methyltransferase [Embleya hyalina]
MGSRYEPLVFDAIPPGCTGAVDVGCGNGGLTRELRRRGIPEVVGIDRDRPCVERCRAHPEAGDIDYVIGDVVTGRPAPSSFDLVSAVASLHHMDARAGLVGLRQLVAPGGVLVVIGMARPELPKDIPVEVAAQIVGRVRPKRNRNNDTPTAPIVWPPPERYATMRRPGRRAASGRAVAAAPVVAVLPGVDESETVTDRPARLPGPGPGSRP